MRKAARGEEDLYWHIPKSNHKPGGNSLFGGAANPGRGHHGGQDHRDVLQDPLVHIGTAGNATLPTPITCMPSC